MAADGIVSRYSRNRQNLQQLVFVKDISILVGASTWSA